MVVFPSQRLPTLSRKRQSGTVERHYAIIEAPSVLGLRPTGVETLPDGLFRAGLATRLRARRAGRIEPPSYDDRRDPETQMLNPHGIANYTPKLADAIGDVLEKGEFPLVLGGDCSIVLGGLLALRRRGRYGLLFVDGHTDFYQPEANINGEAASSNLALSTGRGPDILTTFDGYRPLVQDSDVVVLGVRDAEEAASYGSQLPPPEMRVIDLTEVRRSGVEAAAQEACERVSRQVLAGFWIHLDVDALDDAVMPAVDYRLPGGLSLDELRIILRTALRSPGAAGLEVTIFNPHLDRDGGIARALVEAIVDSMIN